MTARPPDSDEPGDATPARPTLDEIGIHNFTPFLINRISATYNVQLQEMLRPYGLTTPKMRALSILATNGGLTVTELAYLAVFEQSTMSRTLDALVAQGLVHRSQRADDMRVRELHITDTGRAVVEEFWPQLHGLYEDLLAGIDDDDRAHFIKTLNMVLHNLQATALRAPGEQDAAE